MLTPNSSKALVGNGGPANLNGPNLLDLFNENKHIWVSFPGFRGHDSGVFVLGHPNPNVKIPPLPMGDHPINLSAKIHNRQLQECQSLFDAVDKGYLILWEPDAARRVAMSNPEQDAATRERVDDLMRKTQEIDESLRVRMAVGSEEDIVNAKLAYICLQVREKQLAPKVALTQLVPIESRLSEADLEYAVSRGGAAEIVLWARETLQARRGSIEGSMASVEASERKADVVNERRAIEAGADDLKVSRGGAATSAGETASRIAAAKARAVANAA